MLWQRVITALLLLPLVIGIVFFLPLHLFASAVGAVLLVAAWEWSVLSGRPARRQRLLYTAAMAVVMMAIQYFSPPYEFWPSLTWPMQAGALTLSSSNLPFIVLLAAGCFWVLSPVLLGFYPKHAAWWRRSAWLRLFYGLVLLTGLWVALISLRRIGGALQPYEGSLVILFVLLLVWAADVGGYVFGRWLGKRKLAPNISPGKTWAGLFGGVGLAIVVGYTAQYLFGLQATSSIGFGLLMLLTVISSVLGDLMESVAKRETGLKDSGRILPGHGGLLDRIDSLIAAAPVFAIGALLLELR